MESLTASVSFTAAVPRLRITRHVASPTARIGSEQDSLPQATLQLSNLKRPSTYPDSQTSEDESGEIEVSGAPSRLLSASLPPPDSTHSGDTTHRLKALLNRIDNSSRNSTTETRIIMPPSPSEPESDFDLRPAQVARASIKDLFQNAMREPGDSSLRSSSAISNVEFRERLKDNERERQHELERSWNRPHSRSSQFTPHVHEKTDLHGHIPRPGSSPGHLHEDTLYKSDSRSAHDRSRSTSPSPSTDLSITSHPNHIPLPPSPPSPVASKRDPVACADADLARLHRAVAPNFILPARRSPSLSPVDPLPVPTVTSPPRQWSTNSPESQSRTPPPSIEPSDLLDARSFLVEDDRTPSTANEEAAMSVSTLKTPRFPGTFGTSSSYSTSPPAASPTSPQDDAAEEGETTPKIKPVDDLPSTHTQTNGYTSATPAPPGAYRITPTPGKRKGILKVRFDGDAQTPEVVVEDSFPGVVSIGTSKVDGASPNSSSSEDDVPPLSLSPSRRKGLRLVDEYGRARRFTEDGEEIVLDTRRKSANGWGSLMPTVPEDSTMTPRRRAKMRQVDAIGNEMAGSLGSKSRKEPNGEVPEPRRKKAVLSQLTKSLEKLQDDLAEEENTLAASDPANTFGDGDNERMLDLATVSKTARVERNKLSRRLQLERHAEDGIADKIFVARNPRQDLQPWETSDRASWWQRKWRLVLIILILELTLLYMGYRVAMMHTKHIWLKTHFDPFFPALYLHQSRPSFLSRFGPLPKGWSSFAISGTAQRVGVRGFLNVWEDFWKWRLEPWEAWGNPAAGPPVPRPWPS